MQYHARLQANQSLQAHNSFGIDVKAKWWLSVESEQEVSDFLFDNAFRLGEILVLGGGSNILFTQDFDGLVLKNDIRGIELVDEDREFVWVEVGAGENWHEFVLHCLSQGWGGVENLSLIPGSVGAAPIQNIGAYGLEVKDIFHSLKAIHLETGLSHHFSHSDCQFGYRDSVFKREAKGQYLISRVIFRLNKAPHTLNVSYGAIPKELQQIAQTPYSIQDVSKAVCNIRSSKLPNPATIGNAGSFFKNPLVSEEKAQSILAQSPQMPHYPQVNQQVKIPAAWLIEQCGWKGKSFGNYGVYEHQALVLVNHGGATGKDIYELSAQIQASVLQRFDIQLEREVNLR